MTAALEGGEWSAACPGRTLPPERPVARCTGGWVGPRAGLDGRGKSRPHRDSIPDCPAHSNSLYRLTYPAHTLNPLGLCKISNAYTPISPVNDLRLPSASTCCFCRKNVSGNDSLTEMCVYARCGVRFCRRRYIIRVLICWS